MNDKYYEANFELVKNEPIEVTFENQYEAQQIEASFSINPTIGDMTYIHYQDVPSSKWEINHNMNKYPSVTVVSSAGEVVYGNIQYINKNTIQVDFIGSCAGNAYLN